MNRKSIKIEFPCLTILVTVCERLLVYLLKENIAVFCVEHYLRMTQMSRKSETYPKNEFWNFRKFHIFSYIR